MIDKEKYTDIKNAAILIDRSESTVRNLIGGLSKDEKKKYLKKQGQKVWILKSFLASKYEISEPIEDEKDKLIWRLVDMLDKELKEKGEQLKESRQLAKMTLLNSLANKDIDPRLLKKVLGMSDEEVTQIIEIGKQLKDK